MRVLLVEFGSAVSGAERSMLELVQGLSVDHDVFLACPPGPLADRATELGVTLRPIPASQLTFRLHPLHTTRGLAGMANAARRLRAVVRAVRPDVVHANSVRAGLLAIPAARGRSPVIVHCRDTLPGGRAGKLVRMIVLQGATESVAISEHVAASLGGPQWAGQRITVVDNAVDLVRFDPAVVLTDPARRTLEIDRGLVLSVVAQITPWKGQDLAIRVLAELHRRGRDALLLVVGEAKFVGAATRYDNRAFEDELRRLAGHCERDGAVRFLGEREDAERILAATDVLLVPSIQEPFGRTIIEAMAMGVPVAATSVGGPAEILRDRAGGSIVAGRDPGVWADVVEELAGWSTDRRAASRRVAQARFSREHHTVAVLAVYAAARDRHAARVRRIA